MCAPLDPGAQQRPVGDRSDDRDAPPDVVVVTGAASGIGAGITAWLARRGTAVVGVDLTEPSAPADTPGPPTSSAQADAAGPPTSSAPGRVMWVCGDVANEATHRRALQAATGLGRLTGWVNNAGIATPASIDTLDRETLETVLAVNVGGAALGCKTAVGHWLATSDHPRTVLDGRTAGGDGGAIVNISSTQAGTGFDGFPAYAASKGAIESLTRQVAAEYADRGIRCNAVAPGVIATALNDRLLAQSDDPAALRASWDALCPVGRWGTVEDVAEAVGWLLSCAATFVTGHVLVVDGGQSIVPPGPREPRAPREPARTQDVGS